MKEEDGWDESLDLVWMQKIMLRLLRSALPGCTPKSFYFSVIILHYLAETTYHIRILA